MHLHNYTIVYTNIVSVTKLVAKLVNQLHRSANMKFWRLSAYTFTNYRRRYPNLNSNIEYPLTNLHIVVLF